MKKTLVLIFLAIISISAFSQREKIEIGKKYSVAKVYFKDNSIKKVRNLTFSQNENVVFNDVASGKKLSKELSDFRMVKVKTGSNALVYGLLGAGTMALSSIYAAAQIAGDPFLEPKDNAGSIYAGFIIGGAVVGGVIGAASPKWKAMSLPKNQKENQVSYYLAPGYNSQTKSVSLKLSLTF